MLPNSLYLSSSTSTNKTSWLIVAASLLLSAQSLLALTPPATDPALDPEDEVAFASGVLGTHPRLVFNSAELSDLQTAIQSAPLDAHFALLEAYLGASNPPANTNFQTDPTDAQRQGLWRLPTAALHYALTGSQSSFDKAKGFMDLFLSTTHWETGGEEDSGMAAANIMIGAALAYDWLYQDLDSAYRELFRQKLFYHARAMYYGGHIGSQGGYWQGDPLNNHRWHRDAGLVLAMLAVYEGYPEEAWMLRQVYDELIFLTQYLPEDGSSHESTNYQVFGGTHLALAIEAADNCFGTQYLDIPYFKNTARFRAQSIAPGFTHYFMYGDMNDTAGYYGQFNMLSTDYHAQADLQSAIDHHFAVSSSAYAYGWMGLIWRGTSDLGGDYHQLPLIDHFDDIGITFMRDNWDAGGAAAMFKCSPFGGYSLNEYRNANGGIYVNVAHDDPDANAFLLFKEDEWVAETDQYSTSKKSANHNTVLVDGIGQRSNGRAEGAVYSQPGAGDMTTMAYVTWEEDNGDVAITEGEAQGSYPELTRFRRSFIWKSNDYILVLDDVRSDVDRRITWLMQSGSVTTRNESELAFTLVKNSVECEFDVDTTEAVSVAKATSTADHRGTNLGWQQLQLEVAATDNIQIVSVYDLWDKGNLEVSLSNVSTTGATVTVTGNGINDTWEWTFAADNTTASTIALAKPPTVQSGPAGDFVGVNESADLSVARGGLGPLSYQWYQGNSGDTSTLIGTDASTLATGPLSEVTPFWVRITSPYGTVDSDTFFVELTSGFLLWASESISVGSQAEDGDPDNDSVANLIEYALGMSPTLCGPMEKLPSATVADGWLKLGFAVPENGLADVKYEVQIAGASLSGWTSLATKVADGEWTGSATVQIGTETGGWLPIEVKLTATDDSPDFGRLKVSRYTVTP